MRELVEGKNTIGRTAAVLKSPIKGPLTFFFFTNDVPILGSQLSSGYVPILGTRLEY